MWDHVGITPNDGFKHGSKSYRLGMRFGKSSAPVINRNTCIPATRPLAETLPWPMFGIGTRT